MASLKRFEDLEIWQKARLLCSKLIPILQNSDLAKNFRLRDQIEGSSGSIMDNIAEGFDRGGNKEFHNFLSYAKGSAGELKSQLYRCLDKGYISINEHTELLNLCEELQNRIGAFMSYLRKSDFKGSKFK